MAKLFISLVLFILLTSFIPIAKGLPNTIQRTTSIMDGVTIEKTVIEFDKTTSRDDVISTCTFLSKENVQLTFDKLIIGKSFFGVIGKSRIRIAEGKIRLSDGTTQSFKVGGLTNFRSLKIQYSTNLQSKKNRIDMIERID
jgi:hypothetical protein